MLGIGKIWSSKYGGAPAVVGGSEGPSTLAATAVDGPEVASASTSSAEQVDSKDGSEATPAPSTSAEGVEAQAIKAEEESVESEVETQPDDAEPAEAGPSKPARDRSSDAPLPFSLPPYASPFLFIPPNLEVSFRLTSFVFLRAPACGPGYSEVPTPWNADGEVARLAWEWYTKQGQGKRIRRERKDEAVRRRERIDPFAEVHFRKGSAGARVGVAGMLPRARRISASPRGPQDDPHRLVALRA